MATDYAQVQKPQSSSKFHSMDIASMRICLKRQETSGRKQPDTEGELTAVTVDVPCRGTGVHYVAVSGKLHRSYCSGLHLKQRKESTFQKSLVMIHFP